MMDPIRILHDHQPGYDAWYFSSPDLPGLTGSGQSYADAHASAEAAATWLLESDASDAGEPAPERLLFRHYVPEDAAIAA